MIRIRGGKYLHRVIKEPDASITRPTKDMAKEGLFNSLGNIFNKSFLDLFSGSGSIGIEAYSRGANPVILNDGGKEPFLVIKENLKSLGINDIKVFNLDYKMCLKRLEDEKVKFDIIFLDPPYKMEINYDFIEKILNHNVLNECGIIVAETDYDLDSKLIDKYNVKLLKYGRSKMYIIKGL